MIMLLLYIFLFSNLLFTVSNSIIMLLQLPSRSLLNTIKLGGFGNDYSHSPVRSSYRNLFSEPTQRIFNSVICLDFIQKHIQSLRERLDWHDQNDGRLKVRIIYYPLQCVYVCVLYIHTYIHTSKYKT